jgi:hypothetical protein
MLDSAAVRATILGRLNSCLGGLHGQQPRHYVSRRPCAIRPANSGGWGGGGGPDPGPVTDYGSGEGAADPAFERKGSWRHEAARAPSRTGSSPADLLSAAGLAISGWLEGGPTVHCNHAAHPSVSRGRPL